MHDLSKGLEIVRFAYTDMGTFGKLNIGEVDLITVERPWLNNMSHISCIPEGVYECKPRHYFRGDYPAFEITNVPHRTHILGHIGTTMLDVAGCVAVTSRLGWYNGMLAGLDSAVAFNKLMQLINDRNFVLTIKQFQAKVIPQRRFH